MRSGNSSARRGVTNGVRRFGALCLLFALFAGHASTVGPAIGSAAEHGEHHHAGCPWEARDEPCPHAAPPASPEAPEWAPCPPMEHSAPLAAGPDLAPPVTGAGWAARSLVAASPTRPALRPSDVRRPPDPRPPRGALAIAGS